MDSVYKNSGVTIVSEGTIAKVYDYQGNEIKQIYSIDIAMRPNSPAVAVLNIHVDKTTIEACPLLHFESVQKAADLYGYLLMKNFAPKNFETVPENKNYQAEITMNSAEQMGDFIITPCSNPGKVWIRRVDSLEGGEFSAIALEDAINKTVEKFFNDNF